MDAIGFSVRLAQEDWDQSICGWHCQVLRIPGLQVEAVYINGNRIDQNKYEVDHDHTYIRVSSQTLPTSAVLAVRVPKNLASGDETERWKRRAVVFPAFATVVAATITAAATLSTSGYKYNNISNSSANLEYNRSHIYQEAVSNNHTRVTPIGSTNPYENITSLARNLFSIPSSDAISKWTQHTCDDLTNMNYVSINGNVIKWQLNNDIDIEDIKTASGNQMLTETISSKHDSKPISKIGTIWTYVRVNDVINITKDGVSIGHIVYCK